jgi:hypothetical protein
MLPVVMRRRPTVCPVPYFCPPVTGVVHRDVCQVSPVSSVGTQLGTVLMRSILGANDDALPCLPCMLPACLLACSVNATVRSRFLSLRSPPTSSTTGCSSANVRLSRRHFCSTLPARCATENGSGRHPVSCMQQSETPRWVADPPMHMLS